MKRPFTAPLISVIFVLSGCAQYAWVSPGKSQSEFNTQLGSCRNEAIRTIPQPAPSVPPPPIVQAPTTTDCQRDMFGNFQCTTQPNHSANLYGGIVASNNDMWARNRYNSQLNQYVENCLMANGWTLQKVAAPANTKSSASGGTQPTTSSNTPREIFKGPENGKPWSINYTSDLPAGMSRSPDKIEIESGSNGVLLETRVTNDGLECVYQTRNGSTLTSKSKTSCPSQLK
jgi:hypothetical protein